MDLTKSVTFEMAPGVVIEKSLEEDSRGKMTYLFTLKTQTSRVVHFKADFSHSEKVDFLNISALKNKQ